MSAARPDLLEAVAASFDLGEDAFDTRGRGAGHRFIVPRREQLIDNTLEFFDAAAGPAPDSLLFELSKPALDEIEPTGTGRDKVAHAARSPAQPRSAPRVAREGVVIHDQGRPRGGWILAVDFSEEAQELLRTMPRAMPGDHAALQPEYR